MRKAETVCEVSSVRASLPPLPLFPPLLSRSDFWLRKRSDTRPIDRANVRAEMEAKANDEIVFLLLLFDFLLEFNLLSPPSSHRSHFFRVQRNQLEFLLVG